MHFINSGKEIEKGQDVLCLCHYSHIYLIYFLLYFEKTLMGNMTLTGLPLQNTSHFARIKDFPKVKLIA